MPASAVMSTKWMGPDGRAEVASAASLGCAEAGVEGAPFGAGWDADCSEGAGACLHPVRTAARHNAQEKRGDAFNDCPLKSCLRGKRRRLDNGMASTPYHLDDQRNGTDEEERIQRRVDTLIEPEEQFSQGDEEGDDTLGPLRPYGRLGVRDHEEREELILGTRDRRDLRKPWIARDPRAHDREEEERRDVRDADMESAGAPDDQRAENPDDRHRSQVISPLDAERGHRIRCQKEHGRDAEVRWVEEMAALDTQHVLRGDRKQRADDVGPVAGRAKQNADADARDVGACEVGPLMEKQTAEGQFANHGRENGQTGLLITLENAEGKMADQQNERNERRRDIRIHAAGSRSPSLKQGLVRGSRRLRLHRRLAHFGSSIVYNLSGAGEARVCTLPEGQ